MILEIKQGPYEHEQIEGFDKLSNLKTYVEMEVTMQQDKTKQIELAS